MSTNATSSFDLFLAQGLKGALDTARLGAPPLSSEIAQTVLHCLACSPPPGVLEVALPKRLAWELMERLRPLGATGDILEVAYRTPRISSGEAREVAEQTLANWLATRSELAAYSYEPLHLSTSLTHGKARWWRFFARSPELQEQGRAPGGASIYVDKVDGHAWTSEELDLIGCEWDRLLYLFPGWRER